MTEEKHRHPATRSQDPQHITLGYKELRINEKLFNLRALGEFRGKKYIYHKGYEEHKERIEGLGELGALCERIVIRSYIQLKFHTRRPIADPFTLFGKSYE